jgi:predicted kinase
MNKLYIFCGIPFSGKTVLTKKLERRLDYKRIDLDEVKTQHFGRSVKDSDLIKADWDRVYQMIYKQIEKSLLAGDTVIYDTGNFTKLERNRARTIAEKLQVESITVFVDTPVLVARERLLVNRKTNMRFDVTDEDFEHSIAEMESPDSTEKHIVYKDGQSIEEWIKTELMSKISNDFVKQD